MAARLIPPTSIDDVMNGVIDASCPIISRGPVTVATCPPSNAIKWRAIYTEMGPDTSKPNPQPYVVIQQRVAGAGVVDTSKRICATCGLDPTYSCDPTSGGCLTPNVPNIATIGSGQSLYAFEVFYSYSPITVLGNFVGETFAANLYERSIF